MNTKLETKKDINYYNAESISYSKKRYPKFDTDYVHFFFKKRRNILMGFLDGIVGKEAEKFSLLEIGCADGVIVRGIERKFSNFSKIIGIDISPSMIAEAIKNSPRAIQFYVRGEEGNLGLFDIVIEVGVLNLVELDTDLRFAKDHLADDGYYICSLAGKNSLLSRLRGGNNGFKNSLSFSDYETIIEKNFVIVDSRVYGIFIPLIWKIPFLGRFFQPFFEATMELLFPGWFHEKIYLLQKN